MLDAPADGPKRAMTQAARPTSYWNKAKKEDDEIMKLSVFCEISEYQRKNELL